MALEGLDHFTIRVPADELPLIRNFYVGLLGLEEGARPNFDFPGHWLYLDGRPVVHVAGRVEGAVPEGGETGRLDHIAFRATGLAAMRDHLQANDIAFREQPVPGQGLYQLFLIDPVGIQIEINYPGEEAQAAAE